MAKAGLCQVQKSWERDAPLRGSELGNASRQRVAVQCMEKGLLARLLSHGAGAGRVLKTWPGGLLLGDSRMRPVYFHGPFSLFLPFGAACDPLLAQLLTANPLPTGCRVWKEEKRLFPEGRRNWCLDLSSCQGVDLRRKRGPAPSRPGELACRLAGEVVARGNLSGLAGAAARLLPGCGRGGPEPGDNPFLAEAWSWLQLLLGAGPRELARLFPAAFSRLAGLGPGLTPSGDDLITGFLLAHHLAPSPLAELLQDGPVRARLTAWARAATTPVGAELIFCALRGRFGQPLYSLWDCLGRGDQRREHLNRLLGWGGTSGADTLCGLALGLATIK